MTIPNRLTECRARTDYSFRDLDKMIHHSFTHLRSIHIGEKKPKLELLVALASVYHTTVEWLRDGLPEVNAWSELQSLPGTMALGASPTTALTRVNYVLSFLSTRYSGHLTIQDIAQYIGIDDESFSDIREGREPLTEDMIHAVAEISGVPATWLKQGNLMTVPGVSTYSHLLTNEEMDRILALAAAAKQKNNFDTVAQLLQVLASK